LEKVSVRYYKTLFLLIVSLYIALNSVMSVEIF